MASNANLDQIILFDGDEDRIKMFDDITQLSRVPVNCKFYIFCDDPPILQGKLLSHPAGISRICVRQSSNGETLRATLKQEIENYSFILIVCGSNSPYEEEFHPIWKRYGRKKLYVMKSGITMKNILGTLREHKTTSSASALISTDDTTFRNYPCTNCSKSFYTKDELQKHQQDHHPQIGRDDLFIDSKPNTSVHKKSNEPEKLFVEPRFPCPICNDDFNTDTALQAHLEQEH